MIKPWGYQVDSHGFLEGSVEYSKESPSEKGIPDLKIPISEKRSVLLETTGTLRSRGQNDVWIRDDKFDYAESHKDEDCWVGHIIEDGNIIRFIKLQDKHRFKLETRMIRGTEEKFRIIPDGHDSLMSPEEFKKYLDSKKS